MKKQVKGKVKSFFNLIQEIARELVEAIGNWSLKKRLAVFVAIIVFAFTAYGLYMNPTNEWSNANAIVTLIVIVLTLYCE